MCLGLRVKIVHQCRSDCNKVALYTVLKATLNIYQACTKDSYRQRDMADMVRAILLGKILLKMIRCSTFLVQAKIQ